MSTERTEAEVIRDAYSPEHMLLRAPVQGYQGGIPWPIHLEAYDAYCKRYGRQTALINLKDRGCRGGFGTEELDMFVPGWRERVSPITELQKRVVEQQREIEQLRANTTSQSKDEARCACEFPCLSAENKSHDDGCPLYPHDRITESDIVRTIQGDNIDAKNELLRRLGRARLEASFQAEGRVEITDEVVNRACNAYQVTWNVETCGHMDATYCPEAMRAALKAAFNA